MTTERLREMLQKATPGPWEENTESVEHPCCYDSSFTESKQEVLSDGREMPWKRMIGEAMGRDSSLIVAAINALPALLTVVEQAQIASDRLNNWSWGWDGDCGACEALRPLEEAIANLEKEQP